MTIPLNTSFSLPVQRAGVEKVAFAVTIVNTLPEVSHWTGNWVMWLEWTPVAAPLNFEAGITKGMLTLSVWGAALKRAELVFHGEIEVANGDTFLFDYATKQLTKKPKVPPTALPNVLLLVLAALTLAGAEEKP